MVRYPKTYDVIVTPDNLPQVTITHPAKDVTLTVDGHLEIKGEARDDVGIAREIGRHGGRVAAGLDDAGDRVVDRAGDWQRCIGSCARRARDLAAPLRE
jgi:hypothetical protein